MFSRTKFLLALCPFWLLPVLAVTLYFVDQKNSKHFAALPGYSQIRSFIELSAALTVEGPVSSIVIAGLLVSLLGLLATCTWRVQRIAIVVIAIAIATPPGTVFYLLNQQYGTGVEEAQTWVQHIPAPTDEEEPNTENEGDTPEINTEDERSASGGYNVELLRRVMGVSWIFSLVGILLGVVVYVYFPLRKYPERGTS